MQRHRPRRLGCLNHRIRCRDQSGSTGRDTYCSQPKTSRRSISISSQTYAGGEKNSSSSG